MQRKAFVPGTAALLAALLAGCTGGSGSGGSTDNSNPGDAGTATVAAQPGKYRTLPEPCGAVSHGTLASLLPGIAQLTDQTQRQKAYDGDATLTYDTDRKAGCRWKVESTAATDHLFVDFERVVSYDNSVSDDSQAEKIFAGKQTDAGLPAPSASGSPGANTTTGGTAGTGTEAMGKATSSAPTGSASPSATPSGSSSGSGSPSASPTATPSDLASRALTDLGDEAFLDDSLSSSGSTAKQRTVTVVFRTSNVIVTIEYAEQPTTVTAVPDSQEMQDRARKLAAQLAGSLGG
ncbi:DUF3558 domain-containing protein [Streptomyces sp. NPDC047000]|uniref:DUF3558 domain-containing protein n=1 Tax=Streptomyces sp. NPDC047000 TaxID=3155474 RepID=UPI0033E85521